jgi:hypothetical protein
LSAVSGAQFLKESDLEPARRGQSRVERAPWRLARSGDQRGSGGHEGVGRRRAVGDLEGDAHLRCDLTADLDLIDHPLLCGIGDLERGATRVEDRDASSTVALKCGLLGQPEHVLIEVERLLVILRLDDEPHLDHGATLRGVGDHRSTLSRKGAGGEEAGSRTKLSPRVRAEVRHQLRRTSLSERARLRQPPAPFVGTSPAPPVL